MKKLRCLSLFMLLFISAALLVGCDNGEKNNHIHDPGTVENENVVAADCKSGGSYDEVTYCTLCGEELSRITKETPPLNSHTPGDWIIDTQPTCTSAGTKHKSCTVCETTLETAHIEKLDEHTPVTDERVEPTDTENGLTEGSHCSSCGTVLVKQEIIPSLAILSSGALTVNGNQINGTVSNATATFNFSSDIKISNGAEWILSLDQYGLQSVITKTVPLYEGENCFYIHVSNAGEITTYEVNIYRLHLYTITFETNGGTPVDPQSVEEGSLISAVETSRDGYNFAGWSYDITIPPTESITISADWIAKSDTVFYVKHYLQSLQGDTYELTETETFNGTTDGEALATVKDFPHFSYNEQMSTSSGIIGGSEALVLELYYSRNKYEISLSVTGATASGAGTYPYGTEVTVSLICPSGYIFSGWYSESDKISTDTTYVFTVSENLHLTSSISANEATPYKVIYLLEELDGTYRIEFEEILYGTTGTDVSAQIKSYPHFVFDESQSTIHGNINGEGDSVLYVYYTRNVYTVSAPEWLNPTGMGSYPYGTEITVSVSYFPLGYQTGWYAGAELVYDKPTYSFTVSADTELKCSLVLGMEIFNFSSNDKNCTVTGLKDKTVTDIIIPSCVTEISTEAFQDLAQIKSVTMGDSVQKIGGGAFQRSTALESVVLGNGITAINTYVFRGCTSLSSITFGENVESIGNYAFYQCSSLKTINIPKSVKTIGARTFYECQGLLTIQFNGSLTSIGERAFFKCASLYTVVIPEGVSKIEEETFAHCQRLYSVTIPSTLETIGTKAFYNCGRIREVVNNSKLTLEGDPMNHGYLTKDAYVIHSGTSKLERIDDFLLLEMSDGTLCLVGYLGEDTEIVLPDLEATGGITYVINSAAFKNYTQITELTISDAVIEIRSSAFRNYTALKRVYISESVRKINQYAFAGCSALTEAIFESSETWECTYSSKHAVISPEMLADATAAAGFLRSTYQNYTWSVQEN